MGKEKKINLIFLVLNLVLIFLGLFFIKNWTFSALDDWINRKFYTILALNPDVRWSNKVALIKIDEKFFDKEWVTTWTFHRWYYAKLIKKLNSWWAKNIVMDVFFWKLNLPKWWKAQKYFNATINYFNNQLIKALSGNIVLWVIPGLNNSISLPDKSYLSKGVQLGYVESYQNKNWVNIGVIPYKKLGNSYILTLGIAAYLNRLYVDWVIWKKINVKVKEGRYLFFKFFKLSPDLLVINTTNPKISLKIPLSKWKDWNVFLFTRLFLVYPKYTYSLYDVLNNKIDYPESIFDGKTVFVWATDQALNDIKLSYLGLIPWVSFHINTFLDVYSKTFVYKVPFGIIAIIVILLFLFGYFFVILWKDQFKSVIAFISLSIGSFIAYIILFISSGIIIPIGSIILLFLLKLLLDITHILFITGINKEKFRKWFTTYVWELVLEKKEKTWDKSLWERKPIALLFSDIASFTNISEKLSATEVVRMLNIYFDKANFLLGKTNVYIDKYIGDAIMAFWENDINFDLILEKVLKFQKIHPYINKLISEEIGKPIELKTRIGLHYGDAVVGDIWTWAKLNYTAIWDNVNLASRLEWINKYYGSRVILSENFYKNLRKKWDFAIRLLDKIAVKWKTEPVKIYELMLFEKDEITNELLEYIKEFKSGLLYYFDWNFKTAKVVWEQLLSTKYWKSDKALTTFLERISFLLENKPSEWDGVWRFTTK